MLAPAPRWPRSIRKAETMNPNSSRGLTFAREAKAMYFAKNNPSLARAWVAGHNYANERELDRTFEIKATVAAGNTTDWGLPTPASFDLADFIRPLTIVGRLTSARRVPNRVRTIAATSGSSASWVGEAQVRPITKLALHGGTLEPLSIVAILVTTAELMKSASPDAEGLLARDIAAAAVAALDVAFIDPTNSGTSGVKPASVTNGVTVLHSAGSTLANIDSDLGLLIQALGDAGSDLQNATFIMRPKTALFLARLRGSGGALAYPGMTAKGGTILGCACITSASVPIPSTTSITLVDPTQIEVLDEGAGDVTLSEQGSLSMSDSPSSPSTMVSLWQTETVGLKITRYANWQRCRDGMAQVLDQVAY